jgi:hypothetical protein
MTLELKIVVGSTRPGRAADLVLPWLVDRSVAHGAFAVEVLDLRDWPLPMFGETHEAVMGKGGGGRPRDPRSDARLTVLLDDLAWWGEALRRARDAGELPPPHARRAPAPAAWYRSIDDPSGGAIGRAHRPGDAGSAGSGGGGSGVQRG